MQTFLAPNFCGKDGSEVCTAVFQGGLLPITWQSSVELRLLISVYEAWQWSRIQNLRRVG